MGTQGLIQGEHDVGARDERARRQRARADDLRHRRHRRHGRGARPLARGRPRGVAERALPARLGLEPDVDGAAPVAQAARRAQQGGARWSSSTRSAAAPRGVADEHLRPLPGHRRRARDRDDARGRRRRPRTTRTGAAPTPTATTSCSPSSTQRPSRTAPPSCGVDAETIARDRARVRHHAARAAAARRGRPAPRRRARRLRDDRLAARAHGAWRDRGGGCSYIPTATAGAVSAGPLQREDLRPGPVRTINMSQLGEALTDPALDPPVKALVCWNSNPAAIAPDQERVLEGLRRDDLFTVVLEQFMTDTAAHADVVLPATTQLEHLDVLFSWGHHYLTWNEPAIEPLGEAKPNTEIFRLLAARLGLDDPCFRDTDEELVDAAARRLRARTACASAAGPRSTSARARCRTPRAASAPRTAARMARTPDYEPPAEVADAELAERFPLALVTPKTHLFLNSTFANQQRQHSAQPAPEVVREPRRRRRARHRGRRRGAGVQRPRLVPLRRARVRRRPARACWWRRWAGGTPTTRAAAAPRRRRSQRADRARATRRPSTTTASRSSRPSGGSGRSPASRAGCGRPPR